VPEIERAEFRPQMLILQQMVVRAPAGRAAAIVL
jgi:hypothetical protein